MFGVNPSSLQSGALHFIPRVGLPCGPPPLSVFRSQSTPFCRSSSRSSR